MSHPRRSILTLIAAVTVGCQSAGSGPAANPGSAAATGDVNAAVIDLLEQHRKALLARDVATLDRIWTDDFIFINYRGQLLSKANRLENVRTGATAFTDIQFTNEVVRALGDAAAVLIGVVTLDGQYSGEEGAGTYRFISVCTRRGGEWLISVLQMTRMEK
jgi:ketosteroid isomerase-like protein